MWCAQRIFTFSFIGGACDPDLSENDKRASISGSVPDDVSKLQISSDKKCASVRLKFQLMSFLTAVSKKSLGAFFTHFFLSEAVRLAIAQKGCCPILGNCGIGLF